MAKIIGKEKTRVIGLQKPAQKGQVLKNGNELITVEAVEVKEPKEKASK